MTETKQYYKKNKIPVITHPEQDFDRLKKKGVSVSAILDRVRPRIDGTYTVRIMLIFNRFPKYYSTKISMKETVWMELAGGKRVESNLRSKKIIIHEFLRKALDVIYELNPFTFEEFELNFLQPRRDRTNVYECYSQYLAELKEEGRLGSAVTYEYSLKSLQEFTGKSKLFFNDITPAFLNRYERWMIQCGKSPTTVGIYLRPLRHLFNKAIRTKTVDHGKYPFAREPNDQNYKIPTPRNIKKALSIKEVKMIYNYPSPESSTEEFYKDLWIFSYLCNGINMKDICLLKYGNIKNGRIYFNRAKTASTRKAGKQIDIVITPPVENIIVKWGVKPVSSESYIFPFLKVGMTAAQEKAQISQVTKQCNKYIKRIAVNLGLKDNISTYTARHSFATHLLRSGVNVAFISDSLGHSSMKVTQSYLASFEDEAKKEVAQNLANGLL